MLDFIGFALIVQLLLAITIEMARDMFSEHRRKLARLLNLPTSFVLLVRTLTAKVLHWTAVDYKGRARDTAIDRLQSFREANPANPTHLVVFVRGTFGGPGYDSRWDRLATALTTVHPHTAFFCFYWPGHNSERPRRSEGSALAQALVTLSTRHARLPIVAIGHSHGGSVIEHALRHLPSELSIVPILLATPDLQYDEKLVDRPNAHLTALLYAGAVAIPAVLSLLAGWALALLGSPGLNIWNDQWLLPAGILVVALVFALRPAVRRAREALCAKQPKPRHKARRIWCHGDEVFYMFARADAVRNASETLRVAVIERLERLQDEPWVRMILFELAACALCWGFMAASVRELARTDPAMLHPLIQQPGVLRDASILLAAMLLKLIVYGRPRVYRALASMTSLVLFAMNAGLAQLCRVSLAGLSFTEGILVEVQTRLPIHDGVNQIEVASSALPDWKMGVHSATLGDVAVLQALQEIVSAIAVD